MRRALIALSLLLSSSALACNKSEPAPTASSSGSIAPATLNTGTALLSVGAPAPNLEAVAHNGEKVKLADLKGKPVAEPFLAILSLKFKLKGNHLSTPRRCGFRRAKLN